MECILQQRTMTTPYVIYESRDSREKLEVKVPLQILVNVEDIRKELGIPQYVDRTNFQMTKIVAALWAFSHPDTITQNPKEAPLKVAVFGGGAFRLCCPSANHGPLSRGIGDVDFVTLKENGKRVVETLCGLGERYGSMFFHGVPEVDKRFNTLRTGMRYRLRTIRDTDENRNPVPGMMDIFCDKLTFCHTLDVREELMEADKHLFTIGLENLMISKAQYITTVSTSQASNVDPTRIMGDYDKKHLLIGMESKDMRDMSAALLDHELGEGPEKISVDILGQKLRQDWGLWKTVTLNLKNMLQKLDAIFSSFGVSREGQVVVNEKLTKIVEQLEGRYTAKKSRFGLNKRWWEDVEDQSQPSAHM
jgi:hypothetical protein